MADKIYRVVLDLATKGDLTTPLAGVAKHADTAGTKLATVRDELAAIGSSMGSAFTGAVEKVGAMALGVGMLAGAAGFGAVVHGVVELNNKLESTQISLAAIFGANGISSSFAQGMEMAGDTMKKIRQDAKALPGETEDLIGIFKNISIPAFQAGATTDTVEKMSAKFMAFAAVSGVPMEVAAREAAMLMEGRAGAHNMLGLRLAGLGGDKAEAFNKSTGAERLAFLSKALDGYSASIEYYSHSFDGLSSTFKDNAKNFLRMATEPLFDRIKATLEKVNGWFDANAGKVSDWALHIGDKLADAFDWGMTKIEEWWPAIQKFAQDAYGALSKLWTEFGPTISEAANALKGALSDGSALAKIESILKMYAAVKGGTAIAGVASSGARLAGGLGGADEAGAMGALASPVGLAIGAGVAVEALLLAGAMHAAADSTSEYHEASKKAFSDLDVETGKLKDTVSVNLIPAMDALGTAMVMWYANMASMYNDAISMFRERHHRGGDGGLAPDNFDQESRDAIRGSRGMQAPSAMVGMSAGAVVDPTATNVMKGVIAGLGKGAGGMNIQKVEIVVSSNQDPGRIAELVVSQIQTLNRHPKIAGRTPNFSR